MPGIFKILIYQSFDMLSLIKYLCMKSVVHTFRILRNNNQLTFEIMGS